MLTFLFGVFRFGLLLAFIVNHLGTNASIYIETLNFDQGLGSGRAAASERVFSFTAYSGRVVSLELLTAFPSRSI